ncbi:hypothetical protein MS2017_1451 [Bathymodiolus thermophilus thioautotrophic gill symbiont]|uniref:Uncharacterized protein n=1 Tax=Bathymodiolus thermophilus thioautotrophic gill symbiont TaxID=2360 RepID=A0A3G3IN27_9GAMM|nr:hypothetical protein MS2017_1451 [Bathymodiolus thermophilus thioautotrophic gill symbiont]
MDNEQHSIFASPKKMVVRGVAGKIVKRVKSKFLMTTHICTRVSMDKNEHQSRPQAP